ncbi:hypothetical protein NIES3585_07530 [Nodularia sp. NIES-3585]|nr:hypothetical protein NIES3585_07530 [Nodularia sp. NIES-3585]
MFAAEQSVNVNTERSRSVKFIYACGGESGLGFRAEMT